MISKVKNVQGNGDWEGKYGKMYSFEYEMEDGTVLSANHKTPDGAFPIGAEVEYEVQRENEYGKSGKVSKPQQGTSQGGYQNGSRDGDTQDQIMRQTCLKCAAEFYAQSSTTENDVVMTAARWFTWVKSGEMTLKQ